MLGSFRVFGGDAPLRFGAPPRTVPLLAYLAINRANSLPRETVAGTLWPDSDEESARGNLRRHLHYLSRALPQSDRPWTIGDKRTVQWNPQARGALDIAEFERCCSDPALRLRAIDLYAGDLLEGADDEWLCYERERLRSLQLSTLACLMNEAAASGDAMGTISFARRLLGHDPWREDAMRALMVARYRVGDRAGAVADYQNFVALLRNDLDVEPMPETAAAYHAIASESLPPPLEDNADPRSTTLPGLLPLAGRTQELEHLRTIWSRALRGRGSCVLVGGEAGIGKTRLTQELAREAERDGIVAVGHSALVDATPYHTLADAMRMLPLEAITVDSLWLSVLEPLAPEIRALHGRTEAPPALDAEAEQARLFEAFFQVIAGAAAIRPLLLVLEDVHWCGAAMMAAVAYLARRIARLPVLIVATYREEEIGATHPLRDLRRTLRNDGSHAHLALSNLAAETVTSVLRSISGLEHAADDLARRLFTVSEGNPLFLVEALRDAFESEVVVVTDGRWHIAAQPEFTLPRGAKAAIVERLARLSPMAAAIAEIAAVIGRAFTIELLSAVGGWSEGETALALDELLDRQILRDFGARGRAEYAFSHHLIAAAVYDGASPATLVKRHRRAATFLEHALLDGEGAGAAEVARHYKRAQEPARAAAFFATAAEQALSLAGSHEALAFAAEGLGTALADGLRLRLLRVVAEAARRTLRSDDRRQAIDAMRAIAERSEEPGVICEVALLGIDFFDGDENHELREREIARLEAEAARLDDPRWLGEAGLARAALDVHFGRWDMASDQLRRVAHHAAALGATDVPVRLALAEARSAVSGGRLAEGDAALERAKKLAPPGDHALRTRTLYAEIDVARFKVDWERLRRATGELIDLCERAGDRAGSAFGHLWHGYASVELFEVREARRHLDIAAALYDELGKTRLRTTQLMALTSFEFLYGSIEAAIDVAGRCEALARSIGYDVGAAVGALNLSTALRVAGRFALAKAAALRAVDIARRIDYRFILGPSLCALGAAERTLGELPAALEHFEAGIAIEREIPLLETLGDDLAELVVLYAAAGLPQRAAPIADEALQVLTNHRVRFVRSQSLLWTAAWACRVSGDRARVPSLLAQAREAVESTAQRIDDAQARRAYLSFDLNAKILRAANADVWPRVGALDET
ncbi:MAG: hypothetical protein NVSMB19_15690 [Vulcanimicrobiaceae bacterium]